jgi:hypothetical protein
MTIKRMALLGVPVLALAAVLPLSATAGRGTARTMGHHQPRRRRSPRAAQPGR